MTLKNILKTTLIFLMFLTLVSCKSNNYRTFNFYTIEVLNSDSVPSSLLEEYKNTSIDLYENKLIYHNGLNTKTYKYEFNAGTLEVKGHENATYQIKNDELRVKLQLGEQNVLIIYKVVK